MVKIPRRLFVRDGPNIIKHFIVIKSTAKYVKYDSGKRFYCKRQFLIKFLIKKMFFHDIPRS